MATDDVELTVTELAYREIHDRIMRGQYRFGAVLSR